MLRIYSDINKLLKNALLGLPEKNIRESLGRVTY